MIVSLLLVAMVALAVYVGSHRLGGLATAAVLVIACCGITLIVIPDLASRVAATLGVGRGTDLLLYFAVIGGLFVAAHFYFRTKVLESQIVALTRAIALARADAERP